MSDVSFFDAARIRSAPKQSQHPFVSVVTPFFNTAEYLAECIESVLAQSFTNWEYVLLDNCSTDASLRIAEHYARLDRRIRVLRNDTFLTQVQNYNRALTLISPESKYCKVVEADNWIFPECLSEMVKLAERFPTVGLVGSYYLFGDRVAADGLPYPSIRLSGVDACRRHLFGKISLFGAPTSLLMRSSIVRNRRPFYDEASLHEDTEVCYQVLQSWDFGFVHQVLSFLRTDNVSISTSLKEVDPFSLFRLVLFAKYGRWLVDGANHETYRKRIERWYFEDLVELLVTRKRRAVWRLHKKALSEAGYTLRWLSVLPYAIWKIADFTLNIKKTLGTVRRISR